MRWTATLIAFAALGSSAPLVTFAQDNPEAVGVATSEELIPANVDNAVGEPMPDQHLLRRTK